MNFPLRILFLCFLGACAPLHSSLADDADQFLIGSVDDPDWVVEVPVTAEGKISTSAKEKYGVQHGRISKNQNLDLWQAWQSGEGPRRGIMGRNTQTRARWIGLRKDEDGWACVYRAVHPYPFKLGIGWDTAPEEAGAVEAIRWGHDIYYAEVRLTGQFWFGETVDLFGQLWEIESARSIETELEIAPVAPQYYLSR